MLIPLFSSSCFPASVFSSTNEMERSFNGKISVHSYSQLLIRCQGHQGSSDYAALLLAAMMIPQGARGYKGCIVSPDKPRTRLSDNSPPKPPVVVFSHAIHPAFRPHRRLPHPGICSGSRRKCYNHGRRYRRCCSPHPSRWSRCFLQQLADSPQHSRCRCELCRP
jgi:hypothetical protein